MGIGEGRESERGRKDNVDIWFEGLVSFLIYVLEYFWKIILFRENILCLVLIFMCFDLFTFRKIDISMYY